MKRIDDPKKQASIALKKAQSHINKVQQMIENDDYCMDIITQLLAVNGLVKSASDQMLKNHLRHCFGEVLTTKNQNVKNKLIEEVITVINLNGKGK